MSKSRPYIKKADLILAVLILAAAAAGLAFMILRASTDAPKSAQIKVNTELYKTVNLSEVEEPYELKIEGKLTVTLEISKDGVRFIDSECPDKLCVHSGLIGSNGSAACLPAGVSVAVKGEEGTGVDSVVG